MNESVLLILLVLLLLLVALFGGGYVLIYWRMIARPVPKLNGVVNLPSLDASVEVLRDKHAIPHIYAASRADLFRAQGYIHAQERLWQMEQQRRTARGRLAELFGEAALEADRFSRVIGFQRAAEAEALTLDQETRQILDWYAQGVNGYMETSRGRLGAEFNLLRTTPDPWSAVDSLAVLKLLAWGLSGNWESELVRLQLVERFGPIQAADLEPDSPEETPVVLAALGSRAITRLVHAAGLLLGQYEQVKTWIGQAGPVQGSNSWVLGPTRTLNGRPLLCNDPHTTLQLPGLWYENHLQGPDFQVSGASAAGVPGIIIGHNERIAWGLTNAMLDVQDLYLERSHPTRPDQYEQDGEWAEATVLEEVIHVRRRDDPHRERVVITCNGPLISGLIDPVAGSGQDVALSLRWTGHAPETTMRALLRLNQASDRKTFEAAMALWCTPPMAVTYADGDGHIGMVTAGRVPLRSQPSGLTPAPGWDSTYAWDAFIPPAELPRTFDPAADAIVAANNKLAGDDYPYFLGLEFAPGWRAARIETLLNKRAKHTLRDMEDIQLDTGSAFAEALAPWIGLLHSDDPWEKAALNAIRNWNHRMDPDSEAALVFHYMLLHLLEMTFGDKAGAARRGMLGISVSPFSPMNGFTAKSELRLYQLLKSAETSSWYADATTSRMRTRDELLQAALTAAVKRIRKTVGDSTLKWDWGRSHQIRYVHPLGSARFLRGFFNRGPFPIGGDGSTPMQTRQAPHLPPGLVQVTPSYRQIYEVGAWDKAESVTTAGQSGHALSDHYDDQITMFREGVYHRMPWTREAVEEAMIDRMRLEPALIRESTS